MKVICEHYKKCDEPCLHRNPHDSSLIENKSCAKNTLFCVLTRLNLRCLTIEDFKVFPVQHTPLFKEKG